jgi:tetratricopeptide (TPR) repeat protein
MQCFAGHLRRFHRWPFLLLFAALTASGQDKGAPGATPPAAQIPQASTLPKAPALVDPNGPAISLQVSEPLFDIAVALNECGYDQDLENSDPLRQHIRDEVNQYLQGSAAARDARDKVCAYIAQHRLANSGRDLAQYVSLALYATPPPDLAPSVELPDMPPDSTQVVEILPLLRAFVEATDLHAIWAANRAAYEDEVTKLHDPLTKMILSTNIYLKQPTSGYDGRRFVVVLEPMLAPNATNARVYGADYVVVASPVKGAINMQQVRHTYLHYVIEPLLYARASSMDRMLPLLKTVRSAPLDYTFRSDIVALVTECLIRAVEARTFDTGIPEVKTTSDARFANMQQQTKARNAYLQAVAAARQRVVDTDMSQGYVLTQYYYDQLGPFEGHSASLKESIGEMVYGMDVETENGRAKHIQFAETGSSDVVSHAPRQLHGLDQAEMKLIKGDTAGAAQLAQQALAQKSGDPAYAEYILGQVALLSGNMDEAQTRFGDAVRLSKDPRTLAWAHIYLGRIHDVEEDRDEAVAEYKAALTVRDGQADTKQAAEKGIKQPFALPHSGQSEDKDAAPVKPPSQ